MHGNKRFNEYNLTGDFGIGYTRKNEEFYFDLEDYDLIKDHCWYIESGGRVCARNINGGTPLKIHKIIMKLNNITQEIDHINRNQTDNRKSNLRICSHMENSHNMKTMKSNTTGFTGIYFRKDTKRYSAKIECNKKIINLGCFKKIEDAIIARLKAEKEYFGEFASQRNLFKKYDIQ